MHAQEKNKKKAATSKRRIAQMMIKESAEAVIEVDSLTLFEIAAMRVE